MNTGIQYTTEWTFVRTTNGVQTVETCRLVKSLNGQMTTFYSNDEAKYLSTAEYQDAFNNTLAYMESLGWEVLPDFDDSCRTNITACPIVPPSKYAVLPIAFVCQFSALAISPPRNTGIKLATTFQYLINGVANGNIRLVKTLTGGAATFYTDNEVAALQNDAMLGNTYQDAFNRTMQYMAQLGWMATPDINVCIVNDLSMCPINNRFIIGVTNVDATFDVGALANTLRFTAGINGNTGQTEVVNETQYGVIVLSDVEIDRDRDNEIVLGLNYKTFTNDIGVQINVDYTSMEKSVIGDDITYTLHVPGANIEDMIIINNGVKTLNLDIEFYILT